MTQLTSPTPERRTTGSVLVADDDPTMLAVPRAALEQDGHEVALAGNGEEACRLFAEQAPDLVMLDVLMPVMSGYEACANLRARIDGERTPILMLTGSDDAEAAARAYSVGATDFQTKPVNWRALRERVKYMLRAKRDADQLSQLAHYDSLTGLPNRSTFRQHLRRGLLRAEDRTQLLAVIFFDLDCFKEINDTFGHGFGDQILMMAAERLGNCLRTGDTVIHPDAQAATRVAGRFGGDEFTVCVSDISNVEGATAVADRIRAALTSPFHVDGRELFVTASTGVSVYPYDGTDADTLLKHADAAMYDAKTKGRNKQALYRPSMSAKSSERLSLAGDLRRAFERDEFRVFYQPKVEVPTRRVVGAEALMRWQHPTRGLLAPPEFMGFAEEIGLGPQIGDWLLQTALSQIRDWSGNGGHPPPIALNLSDTQFRVSGLLERITQTLGEYRVDARCLEFEITEDVIIQSRSAARELLAGLTALGIRTAIDDFGTGQSALSTLRGLPVDALKIDRSFVRDLDVSQTARAIAASIIDIGHHLGMIVIAEGIETEQQLETLNSMGCDQAQGFLFSPGLPAGEFELFLAETGCRATETSRASGAGSSASNGPYLH